ncbi:MAG TPA: ThiF family adenylyltransferase [Longimicrobiales bacterium]|nr:ThiF family adenylyltransferase [Longimicrobiales bacterium]
MTRRCDDYGEMTRRNIGFITAAEQEALRAARVFVCGVGGMGGAALVTLVRAGVGELCVADPDQFERSNLNRQLLATHDTLGCPKTQVARKHIAEINPDARVMTWGRGWVDELDAILPRYPVVINGMDDVRAAIRLYRKAREHGTVVIDAYSSPLPSVVRVGPDDPRPEERLGFPSIGRDPASLTDREVDECVLREIEYVAAHSSSLERIDPAIAAEVLAGTRPRPSFAPVVLLAGELMGGEALAALLGRTTRTDHRGWFLDPWSGRIERPRGRLTAWLRERLARRALRGIATAAAPESHRTTPAVARPPEYANRSDPWRGSLRAQAGGAR